MLITLKLPAWAAYLMQPFRQLGSKTGRLGSAFGRVSRMLHSQLPPSALPTIPTALLGPLSQRANTVPETCDPCRAQAALPGGAVREMGTGSWDRPVARFMLITVNLSKRLPVKSVWVGADAGVNYLQGPSERYAHLS
jgi:hypothetical protein